MNMVEKDERIKIGTVGVDSGSLMIHDPCYTNNKGLQEAVDGHNKGRGPIVDEMHSQVGFKKGDNTTWNPEDGQAIFFQAGYGDGVYAVFATIGEARVGGGKRIKKIEIVLIDKERDNLTEKAFMGLSYECIYCKKKFDNEKGWRNHVLDRHNDPTE